MAGSDGRFRGRRTLRQQSSEVRLKRLNWGWSFVFCSLNLVERQSHVLSKIVQCFHSDRARYKCIVDTQGGALLGRDRSMGHECRMFDEALNSAKTFCERKKLRMLKEPSSTGKIRIKVNCDHAPESVHLASGEFMLRVRRKSRIANQPNFWVLFKPDRKRECIDTMSLH